jgi:serine/threonine protein kinase
MAIVFLQVHALQYMHSMNVIHHDLMKQPTCLYLVMFN